MDKHCWLLGDNAQSQKSEKCARLPTDREKRHRIEKVVPFEVCARDNMPAHMPQTIRYLVDKRAVCDTFKALAKIQSLSRVVTLFSPLAKTIRGDCSTPVKRPKILSRKEQLCTSQYEREIIWKLYLTLWTSKFKSFDKKIDALDLGYQAKTYQHARVLEKRKTPQQSFL